MVQYDQLAAIYRRQTTFFPLKLDPILLGFDKQPRFYSI